MTCSCALSIPIVQALNSRRRHIQGAYSVQEALPEAEIRRVEVVGPTNGSELLHNGLWALAWAAAAMFVYITFRFEWPFAVGAIATMFLDLTKTVGFFALTGFEFNLTSIAAILTIMGFSINDKIVVYDRVRENHTRFKRMPFAELIDLSINETEPYRLPRRLFHLSQAAIGVGSSSSR
jgi:SecD/SecF fusion protein